MWSSTSLKIYNFNVNNKTFVIILLLDRSPRFQGDRRFGSVSTFGNHFVRQFDRRIGFIIGIVFLLERILKCRYNSFLKFSSAKFSSYFSKFWNVATIFFLLCRFVSLANLKCPFSNVWFHQKLYILKLRQK